jgi:hypothetical protein
MIAFGTSVNKESCGVTTAEWGGVFLSGVILSLTLGNTLSHPGVVLSSLSRDTEAVAAAPTLPSPLSCPCSLSSSLSDDSLDDPELLPLLSLSLSLSRWAGPVGGASGILSSAGRPALGAVGNVKGVLFFGVVRGVMMGGTDTLYISSLSKV